MKGALYIKPGAILTGGRKVEGQAVLVEDDRLAAVGPASEVPCPQGAEEIVVEESLLAPGLIDLQINGAFGLDFTDRPDTIWDVAEGLPRYGVTAFLPTVITSPPETVKAAQEVIRRGPPWCGARGPSASR